MSTLLKILLIAIAVYYFLKFAGRILLSRFYKKMGTKMRQDYDSYEQKAEGEVTITNTERKQNNTKDVGEYVDFEEME